MLLFKLSKTLIKKQFLSSVSNKNLVRMFSKTNENNKIVWMDMEMTGLNIKNDRIMEIACLITDNQLNIIAECPQIIINQSEERLANMDEWCTTTHGKTGLTLACQKSTITELDAENQILNFLKMHTTSKASPLAGNSVYMDRLFMKEYLPRIDDYLHYRIIDVSTLKELCLRWDHELYKTGPTKKFVHRAVDDIYESLKELKFYKNHMFNSRSM